MANITIEIASVKVMRSHDYCHFEVSLSSSAANSPELVDELRKQAARLADKAVSQYQIAKRDAGRLLNDKSMRQYAVQEAERIEATAEGDRTVREQATLKAFKDEQWQARRAYDYEDDYDEQN